ncbi:MAG: 50S ribosomal protein L11 methyltransferase [Halanaerobiales bacterium]
MVGDSFLVCPSWHDCPKTSRKIISLDPGQAFGVGTHETTRLAVFFLEELLLRKNISIKNCLDVGTGSGILSIITAKLGVKNILGIDISEVAVKTARKNIKINDVYDKINILEKNIKDNTDNNFQLVVSNLLPQLLLDLSSYLVDSISQNGYLIISGITGEKEKEIKNIFLNRSLKIREKSREGDWISFLMQKE